MAKKPQQKVSGSFAGASSGAAAKPVITENFTPESGENIQVKMTGARINAQRKAAQAAAEEEAAAAEAGARVNRKNQQAFNAQSNAQVEPSSPSSALAAAAAPGASAAGLSDSFSLSSHASFHKKDMRTKRGRERTNQKIDNILADVIKNRDWETLMVGGGKRAQYLRQAMQNRIDTLNSPMGKAQLRSFLRKHDIATDDEAMIGKLKRLRVDQGAMTNRQVEKYSLENHGKPKATAENAAPKADAAAEAAKAAAGNFNNQSGAKVNPAPAVDAGHGTPALKSTMNAASAKPRAPKGGDDAALMAKMMHATPMG